MRSASSLFRPTRYVGGVGPRARVLSFGSAAALVVAGAICAALIGGSTGDALAIALITLGLGAALLLIFLERPREKRSGDGSAPAIDNAGCGLAGGPAGPAERPVLLSRTAALPTLVAAASRASSSPHPRGPAAALAWKAAAGWG